MDYIINRKREMCILFIINLLGLSSIIRANFSYVDDLTRVAFGVHGWEDFGRYISNLLSTLIHGGIYLTDISPLPQIIAIVIIVIAEIILIVLFGNENNMMWNIIAVIPAGLSPYFLECLSFKYDSPYMALSVLFSVIPFLYFKRETKLYFGISFVCLLAMCMTYQAASGIYPMVVLFLFFKEWNKGQQIKKEIKFLLISILAYFASLLSYFLFIVKNTKGYVDNTSIPHISVFFQNCLKNYYHYYSNVWYDFKKTWIVFLF